MSFIGASKSAPKPSNLASVFLAKAPECVSEVAVNPIETVVLAVAVVVALTFKGLRFVINKSFKLSFINFFVYLNFPLLN